MSITGRGVQEITIRHAKHLIAHFMCPFRFILEPEHGIIVVIPLRAEREPDVTVFDINESIAVHLLRKTGNLRLVQKQLGHASPTTTANMYADVSFEDMQAALNGLYNERKF